MQIFTVDGPRVTIDYYADDYGNWKSDANFPYGSLDPANFPMGTTPALHFVKRSTIGYSLNGKENIVAQGATYAMTDDTKLARTMEAGFVGTAMAILDGVNNSKTTTNYNKSTAKAVDTGWTPKDCLILASDVLSLLGMADLGSQQTDTFVLSMSYDNIPTHQGSGAFGIASRGTRLVGRHQLQW